MNTHKHSPGSIISVSNISKINSDLNEDGGNDSGNNDKKKILIEWSYDNEEILAEWCDIAQCYKWLNHHAHDYYSSLHAWFTIPAITFSTISGTASFASASIPLEFQSYAPMAIGTINIMIGILTTIQQYLKVSELKESFRLAAISWDKYARNICIELSKSPSERIDAGTFLKFSRQEYDRLMESNQSIPPHIILKFRRNFRGRTPEEKKRFDLIKKPDICDVIVSINEKRHMWFTNHHQDESNETGSIDTTSTFREYMIFKQNTIRNRSIPYYTDADTIPEPDQMNQSMYDRKFSKENLLKHDHIYNNDIESNYEQKPSEYYRKRNSEYEINQSAPKRGSKDSFKRTTPSSPKSPPKDTFKPPASSAPRRTSKDYAMNFKDSLMKKLFSQVSSNESDVHQESESRRSSFGRYHNSFEKKQHVKSRTPPESEKTSQSPMNKMYSNTNVNEHEKKIIPLSMRRSAINIKTTDYNDNISIPSNDSSAGQYIDSDENTGNKSLNKKSQITLVPFNALSAENKEQGSNNSSNSSLSIKNVNKIVKRVTHESDSNLKQDEENIVISFQEDKDSTTINE